MAEESLHASGDHLMPAAKEGPSIWRTVALLLSALVLGLPLLIIAGSFALNFLLLLGPMIVINYLLWGWWLAPNRQIDPPEVGHSVSPIRSFSPSTKDGIRSRVQSEGYFRPELHQSERTQR